MLRARFKSYVNGLILVALILGGDAYGQNLSTQELQEQAEVERLSAAGVEAYKAKEYSKAVGLFQQALSIQPVPNLLYNIARACELMGDDRKAVFYYTKFIRAQDVSDAARDKARGRLADLEARMLAASPAPEPTNWDEGTSDGPVVLGAMDGEDDLGAMTIAGWVTASGGTALLLVSTVLAVRMGEEVDSFNGTTDLEQKRAYRQNAETLGLTADVGFGVGVALLATGTTLLALEWLEQSEESAASSFQISPQVAPDGLGMAGTFTF